MEEIIMGRSRRAGRFDVVWRGEVIVASSRDPEHDACRTLVAKGITGRLAARWAGSQHVASIRDIETAAGVTIEDGDGGLRRVRYRPFSGPRQEAFGASGGHAPSPAALSAVGDATAQHDEPIRESAA